MSIISSENSSSTCDESTRSIFFFRIVLGQFCSSVYGRMWIPTPKARFCHFKGTPKWRSQLGHYMKDPNPKSIMEGLFGFEITREVSFPSFKISSQYKGTVRVRYLWEPTSKKYVDKMWGFKLLRLANHCGFTPKLLLTKCRTVQEKSTTAENSFRKM